jgi:predicted CoA-substrate-specific enzyme activase
VEYIAGLDLGSVATKVVVCDGDDFVAIAHGLAPTGWQPMRAAQTALDQAISHAGIPLDRVRSFGVTGYGRHLYPEATARATEVTCQARAVHRLHPHVRTIIDIGGQDSKVIRLDEFGNALDFAMNDRCAAGTGRFLEVMAQTLGMTLDEMGEQAASATDVCSISSTCTVFAQTEVVGLLAQGHSAQSVAAGLCHAVARQTVALAARVGLEPPIALVGGVAHNEGVRRALSVYANADVLVPDDPQYTAALGAAILAAETIAN